MAKICAVYKITNTITKDFYIGSSKDVKRRWREHKKPSTWNRQPNSKLYQDMQKYGVDKFELQVLAEVEIDSLKEVEQEFIEKMHPIYNNYRANGWDTERYKETKRKANKEYEKTDKRKKYKKEYEKTDKRKKYHKEYEKTDKRKKYKNQLCCYNGEVLTLNALSSRFYRQGIPHPVIEAKKYLIQ